VENGKLHCAWKYAMVFIFAHLINVSDRLWLMGKGFWDGAVAKVSQDSEILSPNKDLNIFAIFRACSSKKVE